MLFPVNKFTRQSITSKAELVPLEWFWHTIFFIHLTCFWRKLVFKTKKLIDISPYGWCFLFWFFSCFCLSICGIEKRRNTCYIFPQLFNFHCFSRVATNFTFTSETFFRLLLLKFLPSNSKKKVSVKKVERKLEEAFIDGTRWVVQLGHFFYSVSQFLKKTPQPYHSSFL